MPCADDPQAVVQRQLDAYNRRSMDEWLAAYHRDAQLRELHGTLLARGHDEMRARMETRFREPDLHAVLLARIVMGVIVVDRERITRNFADGVGTVDMLCIYEVAEGRIAKATFATGPRMP